MVVNCCCQNIRKQFISFSVTSICLLHCSFSFFFFYNCRFDFFFSWTQLIDLCKPQFIKFLHCNIFRVWALLPQETIIWHLCIVSISKPQRLSKKAFSGSMGRLFDSHQTRLIKPSLVQKTHNVFSNCLSWLPFWYIAWKTLLLGCLPILSINCPKKISIYFLMEFIERNHYNFLY